MGERIHKFSRTEFKSRIYLLIHKDTLKIYNEGFLLVDLKQTNDVGGPIYNPAGPIYRHTPYSFHTRLSETGRHNTQY